MNKKIILGFVLLVLLSFGMLALPYPSTTNPFSASYYKPLNESSGSAVADYINTSAGGTTVGSPLWIPAVYGNGLNFQADDKMEMNFSITLGTQEFTICAIMNLSITQPTDPKLFQVTEGGNWFRLSRNTASYADDFYLYLASGGGGTEAIVLFDDAWKHFTNSTMNPFCITKNSGLRTSAYSLWTNGSNWTSRTRLTQNDIAAVASMPLSWGDSGATATANMIMDEFLIADRVLTAGEIMQVHRGNWTLAGPPPATDNGLNLTVNVSSPYPLNYSQFGFTEISFNATVNASWTFNASLYLNNVLNVTITGFTSGTNVPVNFNLTLVQGKEYNFSIIVDDNTSSSSTQNHTIFVDTENPTIQFTFPNGSVYFKHNITAQFNLTDNFFLYSYNISTGGTQIIQRSGLNVSTFSVDFNYNATTLSVGSHDLTLTYADGHTAKRLGGDYEWSNGLFNTYMKYTFWDEGYVKIEPIDGSIFDSFSTTRKLDRYSFDYEPSKSKTSYTFVIDSDLEIYIVTKESKYKDYLIVGTHWLDFVLPTQPNSNVEITRLKGNQVLVNVSNLKFTEKLSFNSIGDLNIVTQVFNFTVTTATQTFSSKVLESETQEIILDINVTGSILSTNALLFYNGTEKTVTKTSFGTFDRFNASFLTPVLVGDGTSQSRNWYWKYDINGTGFNETGNITGNQTVIALAIDNCSTYQMRAINITVKNEETLAVINSTVGGYFKIWVDSVDDFVQFNLTWAYNTLNSPVGVCISPNESSYNTFAQIEYQDSAKQFNQKTYYLTNYTLNNQTKFLDLFLTNGTTQVKFNVLDFNDDAISDAVIKILSYDLATDSFKVTEILRTDTDGAAYGQIILNTQLYQFLIEVDDKLVFQSLPTIISTTEKTFRVELGDDYYEQFTKVRSMAGNVVFTNSTQVFSYTYSDSTGSISESCLDVVQQSIFGETLFEQQCSTSSAGTVNIAINVGSVLNVTTTFIGTGFVTFPSGDKFILDTESVSFDYLYKTYGKSGLFVGFLLILTLFLVGIWSPVVSIILGVLGVFALTIMKIISLTNTGMITLAILAGTIIYRLSKK